MKFLDLLRLSSSSLWKRKVRTLLTVLGVTIGDVYKRQVEGRAEAVLAASLFHYKELEIREVKEYLQGKGVSVRL